MQGKVRALGDILRDKGENYVIGMQKGIGKNSS